MSRFATVLPACVFTTLIGLQILPLTAYANTDSAQEWHFRVYLDDKPIGYHHFRMADTDHGQQLNSSARFDVTLWKIPLFRYRHENVERWKDNCLSSIESTTDQNGERFELRGTNTERGFQVISNQGDTTLPGCVSTFAYWDKSFLQQDRLLNAQTGEYLEVAVETLGEQSLMIGETSIPARGYRLSANKLDIELWYSRNDQWLALESTVGNGRILRYVIE